jgi:hypothetical protein
MSLQCYALCLVFYASCTYDFCLQTLPSTMQLKRLLVCDHNVPRSRGGALSWSLSRSNLNAPVFSLVVRILAFSTTLVTSKLEVINHPLSSIRTRTSSGPVFGAPSATFKGIWYPSITKLLVLLCPFWHCSFVPSRT